jgi:hypothetical protein
MSPDPLTPWPGKKKRANLSLARLSSQRDQFISNQPGDSFAFKGYQFQHE